jgi:hypothetical protein
MPKPPLNDVATVTAIGFVILLALMLIVHLLQPAGVETVGSSRSPARQEK